MKRKFIIFNIFLFLWQVLTRIFNNGLEISLPGFIPIQTKIRTCIIVWSTLLNILISFQ